MLRTRNLGQFRPLPGRPGRWQARDADDGLVHCRTLQEAEALRAELQARLTECRLELHPTKTKIVYCRDERRREPYPNVAFDFLGFCFRPRVVWGSRSGRLFCGYTPAVSPSALKATREKIGDLNIRRQTLMSLDEIAEKLNPLLRGWIGYYGKYLPSALHPLLRYVNQTLLTWARRKFKRFRRHKIRADQFLQKLAQNSPNLFIHRRLGLTSTFA